MSSSLIILGAGGNVYDLLDIVAALKAAGEAWNVTGFLDDSKPAGSMHVGLPVLGRLREANCFTQQHVFISTIRNEKTHQHSADIVATTGLPLERFATLVHPGAGVSSYAQLGRGVYVNYGASVAGGVVIGNHVSIGPDCIIGHQTVVEDHVILAPGAIISGEVYVEQCTYVGAGAVVRQRLRLGAKSLVGMGAVVVRDVKAGSVVVGNPARPLPKSAVGPDEGRLQCCQSL